MSGSDPGEPKKDTITIPYFPRLLPVSPLIFKQSPIFHFPPFHPNEASVHSFFITRRLVSDAKFLFPQALHLRSMLGEWPDSR